MSILAYLRVEWARLLRSRLTWLTFVAVRWRAAPFTSRPEREQRRLWCWPIRFWPVRWVGCFFGQR